MAGASAADAAGIPAHSQCAAAAAAAIQPAFDVYATTQGRDLGAVAADINKVLKAEAKDLPPGAVVTLRGQVSTMNDAFSGLLFGLLGAMMLSFLGLITSIWAEKFDHAAAVTNFVVTPLALLSGTFYSVDRLAPWFQGVAHANPVYYAIMGFRYGFIGTVDSTIAHPVLTAAVTLLAVNAALGVLTYRLLASGWKLKA